MSNTNQKSSLIILSTDWVTKTDHSYCLNTVHQPVLLQFKLKIQILEELQIIWNFFDLFFWATLLFINQYDIGRRVCACGGLFEVKVALTILKLTQTGRRLGGRAQVSIGMHAHPKRH